VLNYLEAAKHPSFRIKKLKLEYKTVRDKQLQQEISNALTAGVQYFFDHVHYYDRVFIVKKENKEFSATISDVARKSLKGLLLIFKNDFEEGRRNSDRFINPRIEEIKICMGGEVTARYRNGYKEENFGLESGRFFMSEDTKQSQIVDIDAQSYYGNNKFSIFIDLQSTEDNRLHGSGKIQLSGDNILLTMTKKGKSWYISYACISSVRCKAH